MLHNITTSKQNDKENNSDLSDQYFEESLEHFKNKNYEISILYLNKAINLNPKSSKFFEYRAQNFLKLGLYKLALDDSIKCIELDKNNKNGYISASQSYSEMQQYSEGLDILSHQFSFSSTPEIIDLKKTLNSKLEEQNNLIEKFKNYGKYLEFTKWLHVNRCYISKLDIHFFSDDHRGVILKKNLVKDEIFIKIPKDLLISLEVAKSFPQGQQVSSFMYTLNSPKHCLLSTFVLYERKNKNSKWRQYFEILPKDYTNFPIFFTDEELNLLKGSPFLNTILEKKDDIQKDYKKICEIVPDFNQHSFKDFCEVRMAVSSRIFGIKIENKKTDVLAPFADLLNHKRPRQTHWLYDENLKSFVIQALEDISAGNEVYDSYGKKCNTRFLLNYGFIVEDNDSNEFLISLSLSDKYPNFKEKRKIFNTDSEMEKKFKIQENLLESQVIEFFSYLRFILYEGDISHIYKIISDYKENSFEDAPQNFYLIPALTVENETEVLKNIQLYSETFLKNYDTTYEEDLELIKNKNLSNNQRNCILMRLGEKKILKFYNHFSTYCLNLIQLGDELKIIHKLKLDYGDVCPFDFYIYDVLIKLIENEDEDENSNQ